MPVDRNERTEDEPKLAFAKGCLWSLLISLPLWVLIAYWIWR
ncbi:hypothetical protein [Paenibacillus whitsoniae]|nr:hypothetical protein [Paenibacillus whitsoniae]